MDLEKMKPLMERYKSAQAGCQDAERALSQIERQRFDAWGLALAESLANRGRRYMRIHNRHSEIYTGHGRDVISVVSSRQGCDATQSQRPLDIFKHLLEEALTRIESKR